jgi:hypothetical protein
MTDENKTGRSVHQGIKTLEDAVGTFLADYEDYLVRQKAGKYSSGVERIAASDLYPMFGKLRAAFEASTGNAKRVPRKEYERKVQKSYRGDEIAETHESYGLVQISRGSSSGQRLFGSSVIHQHVFTLRILRGMRQATDTGEHFRSDGRVPIVEIAMTPAQFVEMITTQNSGEGVPCTIEHVEGVRMDHTPDDAGSELKVMSDLFKERLAGVVKELDAHDASLGTLLEKKTFTKADKEQIRSAVHTAARLLSDSAPFVIKVFGEHVEKAAAKGKLEVEAFIATALHKVGIRAIRDAGGTLLLSDGEDEKKP